MTSEGIVEVDVALLISHDDQILLGRLPSGFWTMPSAPLVYGQSVVGASQRLAEAACGIGVSDITRALDAPYTISHAPDRHVVTLVLTAQLAEGAPTAPWQWWSEHDLPTPLAPTVRAVLDQIRQAPLRLTQRR